MLLLATEREIVLALSARIAGMESSYKRDTPSPSFKSSQARADEGQLLSSGRTVSWERLSTHKCNVYETFVCTYFTLLCRQGISIAQPTHRLFIETLSS